KWPNSNHRGRRNGLTGSGQVIARSSACRSGSKLPYFSRELGPVSRSGAGVATGCRGGTEERWFFGLFCRAQRRAEIAEFVVNLTGSFNGLSNFFAEQRAIAFAQPVYKTFHRCLLQAERFRELSVGNIFSLRCEAGVQHIKHPSTTALFTFVAQSPQRALDHCRRPAHIENSFRRPIFRLLLWN